jgi:hypothetical protein
MVPEADKVEFAALEARLSPQSQTLLHEAFSADESNEDSVFVEHAQACLKRLESDAFREQLKDLRAQVKSAEREGRLEEAIRLMAELNRREREARAGA